MVQRNEQRSKIGTWKGQSSWLERIVVILYWESFKWRLKGNANEMKQRAFWLLNSWMNFLWKKNPTTHTLAHFPPQMKWCKFLFTIEFCIKTKFDFGQISVLFNLWCSGKKANVWKLFKCMIITNIFCICITVELCGGIYIVIWSYNNR